MAWKLRGLVAAGFLLAVPVDGLADVRGEFGRIAESYVALGQADSAEQLMATVGVFSDAELEETYGGVSGKLSELADLNFDLAIARDINQSFTPVPRSPNPTFPEPVFASACPESSELSFDSFLAAFVVVDVAKAIWAGLDRGCNTIVVAIGVGTNASALCIPVDIVFHAAESVLKGIELCQGDIALARTTATFQRTAHLHTDITEVESDLTTHDAEIKAELALINTKLDAMKDALDQLSKTQLEQMVLVLGGSRAGVMYTDRLPELCDAAQLAIDEADSLGYGVAPGAQAKKDEGAALIATDPKLAHDFCKQAYRLATRGSNKGPN